jgi:hypothetical protein
MGQHAKAVAEFEKVTANHGVDPFATVVPLAQLGIARAQTRAGDTAAARRAYEDLFTTWQGADHDFRPLATARAEYARLVKTSQP